MDRFRFSVLHAACLAVCLSLSLSGPARAVPSAAPAEPVLHPPPVPSLHVPTPDSWQLQRSGSAGEIRLRLYDIEGTDGAVIAKYGPTDMTAAEIAEVESDKVRMLGFEIIGVVRSHDGALISMRLRHPNKEEAGRAGLPEEIVVAVRIFPGTNAVLAFIGAWSVADGNHLASGLQSTILGAETVPEDAVPPEASP